MSEDNYRLGTKALHAGHKPDSETNSRAVPIYQTTAYAFDSSDHAAKLFALEEMGNIYTRLMNPTTDVLEKRLAAMDSGVGALAFASGAAAISSAILNLARAGDNIVSTQFLYGGTYNFFNHLLPRMGIEARFVVFALGTKKRMLGIPGEQEFLGKGVCLCATCDAPFFKDREVIVVGGNDSGTTSALLIAEYASKVTVIEIQDELPSEPVWIQKIEENPKIEVMTGMSVKEIKGDTMVKSVLLDNGKELKADGVFIEIGSVPQSEMIDAEKDKWGHVHVDKAQRTSIEGLYAAGDITDGSNYMRQIVAAQAEGAIAAQDIYKKITKGE